MKFLTNNILKMDLVRKLSLGLLLVLGCIPASVFAESKLSVDPAAIEIPDGEQYKVSVLLTNSEELRGANFNVQLPAGLTLVESFAISNNLSAKFKLQAELVGGSYNIVVTPKRSSYTIAASDTQELMTFTIAPNATMAEETTQNILFREITLTANTTPASSIEQENFSLAVKKVAALADVTLTSISSLELNRTEVKTVEVSLDNSMPLCLVQGLITLPEWMKFVTDEDGYALINSNRIPDDVVFEETMTGKNKIKFITNNDTNIPFSGTTGVLFSFQVEVDVDQAQGVDGNIVLSGLKLVAPNESAYTVEDITIAVTNPNEAAKADAFQYIEDQKEAVAELDITGITDADVVSTYNDLKSLIEVVDNMTNESYENGTLHTYVASDTYSQAKIDIASKFDAFKAAMEAYEKKVANDTAYDTLKAELDALDAAIAAAKADITENAPDVKDDFLPQLDPLQAKVDDARAALEAAHDAGQLNAESTNAELPTQAEIDAIVDAAKAAQAAKDATPAITVVDSETGAVIPGVTANVVVLDETDKTLRIESLNVPASAAAEDLTVYIPTQLNDYDVVAIADNAFAGQNVTDVYMPDTESPVTVGNNAIPGLAVIHTSLALLDDYALMATLGQNYQNQKVMTTVRPVNRLWTLGTGVDVIIPEDIIVSKVQALNNSEVQVTNLTESELNLGGQRVVKANNGVLLDGLTGTSYDLVAYSGRIASGTPVATGDNKDYGTDNCLEPVVEKTHFEAGAYFIMSNNEFHAIKAEGDEVKVPAGKAVLHLAGSQSSYARVLRVVDGTTTAIEGVVTAEGRQDWYTIDGRKLGTKPVKGGLYIVNGKKTIVK